MTTIRDSWQTPQKLFNAFHNIYDFTVDVAAGPENHKCKRYYSEYDSGLEKSWKKERVFCNPPYSAGIGDWLAKAHEAELALYLLPNRTDQKWFHKYVMHAPLLLFLKGRVQFDPPPGITKSSNREGSIVVVYGDLFEPGRRLVSSFDLKEELSCQ